MRAEKQFISNEYLERLNQSPFFIVIDYTKLKVSEFSELRGKLRPTGSELHVVKNSIFRVTVKQAGLADLTGAMAGQMAVVTGQKDISATAKVLKTFATDKNKAGMQFGYLGNQKLKGEDLVALADLPSIEVLRSKLLGVLQAPAGTLVRLLNTPASQLAQVLKARFEKADAAA